MNGTTQVVDERGDQIESRLGASDVLIQMFIKPLQLYLRYGGMLIIDCFVSIVGACSVKS